MQKALDSTSNRLYIESIETNNTLEGKTMKAKNLGFIIEVYAAEAGTWKQLDDSNRFTTRRAAGVKAKERCADKTWRVTPLTA